MDNKIRNILIIIILISTIGGSFYWFELRPVHIRQSCFELFLNEGMKNEIYDYCIDVGGAEEMMQIINKIPESDN